MVWVGRWSGLLYTHDFSGTIYRIDAGNLSGTPVASNTGDIVGCAITGIPAPGATAVLGLTRPGIARCRG